jgi:hypothetical protein
MTSRLLNPVRAGLVEAPTKYPWSSAAAHARGPDDGVVKVGPLLELAPNWRSFLARVIRDEDIERLRSHAQTGRPLGEEAFLATLEEKLERILRKQKPGPKGQPKNSVSCPPNPWVTTQVYPAPNPREPGYHARLGSFGRALTLLRHSPMAMPWAVLFRPFRVSNSCRARFRRMDLFLLLFSCNGCFGWIACRCGRTISSRRLPCSA